MELQFDGKIFYWRGPAPWYFITIPAEQSGDIKTVSFLVTYGWGCIPVRVTIGNTEFTTALFPKDDRYLLPIKTSVRQAENLELEDTVTVRLEIKI